MSSSPCPAGGTDADYVIIAKRELDRICMQMEISEAAVEALRNAICIDVSESVMQSLAINSSSPAAPPGMSSKSEVTIFMKQRQNRDPHMWTMSVQQWIDVIEHIKGLPSFKQVKNDKYFGSMYDVNELMVKPWSRDTGCGLAVLMTKEMQAPAQLMLSHAWGEDLEEMEPAVQEYCRVNGIGRHIMVWFCVFANYQPEDGAGPSISEQLKLEPFACVIKSPELRTENGGHGMSAVHTTREDLYGRLWCVHEVDEAKSHNVDVGAAMSEQYVSEQVRRVDMFLEEQFDYEACLEAAGISVNTIRAKCGNHNDEKFIVERIRAKQGGFDRLNAVVADFRLTVLPDEVKSKLEGAWKVQIVDGIYRQDGVSVTDRVGMNARFHFGFREDGLLDYSHSIYSATTVASVGSLMSDNFTEEFYELKYIVYGDRLLFPKNSPLTKALKSRFKKRGCGVFKTPCKIHIDDIVLLTDGMSSVMSGLSFKFRIEWQDGSQREVLVSVPRVVTFGSSAVMHAASEGRWIWKAGSLEADGIDVTDRVAVKIKFKVTLHKTFTWEDTSDLKLDYEHTIYPGSSLTAVMSAGREFTESFKDLPFRLQGSRVIFPRDSEFVTNLEKDFKHRGEGVLKTACKIFVDAPSVHKERGTDIVNGVSFKFKIEWKHGGGKQVDVLLKHSIKHVHE